MTDHDGFKDDFEKQLNHLRDQLDVEDVDVDAMWTGIHHQLPKKKRIKSIWFAAASIVLLAGFLSILWLKPEPKAVAELERPILKLADVSEELAGQEASLLKVIDGKWNEIDEKIKDKSEFTFIYDELDALNDLGKEYEAELQRMGPNEKIIQTILKCYERRIQLLEMLARESQKPKNQERNDSTQVYL